MSISTRYFGSMLAVTILAAASRGNAQPSSAQTGAAVYRSAYFLGRGDTGIAEADREDAIFYNPAGLAQGTGIYKKTVFLSPQVEFSQGTHDVASTLGSSKQNAVDTVENNLGKPLHVGAQNFTGLIFRRAAFGVIASSHIDFLAYHDPNSGGLEAVHAAADQTLGTTFTLADKFLQDRLLIGITGKYLERARGDITASAADVPTIQDQIKSKDQFMAVGTGGGADLGFMYQIKGKTNFNLGLCISDLGDTNIKPQKSTSQNLSLRQTINFGSSVESGTNASKIKFLLDIHDLASGASVNPILRTHLGGEISVLGSIGATFGLNQGYLGAGFYIDAYLARVDLGTYAVEASDHLGLRPDRRYFIRLTAGL